MKTKQCPKCLKVKPISGYSICRRDGFQSRCKTCRQDEYKENILLKRKPFVNFQNEVWKDVVGYEGLYEVSSFGRVKNKATWRILKHTTIHPYFRVTLSKGGTHIQYSVHRLQAAAFLPNPHNKPQVNHKNGNKKDNTLSNLEWVTISENVLHSYANGFQKVKLPPISFLLQKLTPEQVKEIRNSRGLVSACKMAKVYNISKKVILNILHGVSYKNII